MFEITKRPIVIFSSARTGSTVLTANICLTHGIDRFRSFHEPDKGSQDMAEFVDYYHSTASKNFILKVHLYHLDRYDAAITEFLTQSDSVFRIKLQRRDVIKQIASHYIGRVRKNKWRYLFENRSDDPCCYTDSVPVHASILKNSITQIVDQNRAFVDCPIKFDLELLYEDLPVMHGTGDRITPKPANYQEIIDAIGQHSEFIDRATNG